MLFHMRASRVLIGWLGGRVVLVWLIGWLVGWLAGGCWLAGWVVGGCWSVGGCWLAGCLVGWLAGWLAGWLLAKFVVVTGIRSEPWRHLQNLQDGHRTTRKLYDPLNPPKKQTKQNRHQETKQNQHHLIGNVDPRFIAAWLINAGECLILEGIFHFWEPSIRPSGRFSHSRELHVLHRVSVG